MFSHHCQSFCALLLQAEAAKKAQLQRGLLDQLERGQKRKKKKRKQVQVNLALVWIELFPRILIRV